MILKKLSRGKNAALLLKPWNYSFQFDSIQLNFENSKFDGFLELNHT